MHLRQAARVTGPSHVFAFENSIKSFAEHPTDTVIKTEIRASFKSIEEAYDFYNLYFWKVGFDICYWKSRLNIEKESVCKN
jgi:hypothetical protein